MLQLTRKFKEFSTIYMITLLSTTINLFYFCCNNTGEPDAKLLALAFKMTRLLLARDIDINL